MRVCIQRGQPGIIRGHAHVVHELAKRLTGHGFAQVVRVEARPVELHRMDPGAVSIEYDDFGEAQQIATQWLWTYNNERPNMGIGGITPARDN